jgi:hypothetical protein
VTTVEERFDHRSIVRSQSAVADGALERTVVGAHGGGI